MPQNTDNNNNTDETGTLGLVTGSNSVLIEPPDPPDQNDTRIVEIGQHGSVMDPEAQAFDGDIIATTSNATDNNDDAIGKKDKTKEKQLISGKTKSILKSEPSRKMFMMKKSRSKTSEDDLKRMKT